MPIKYGNAIFKNPWPAGTQVGYQMGCNGNTLCSVKILTAKADDCFLDIETGRGYQETKLERLIPWTLP